MIYDSKKIKEKSEIKSIYYVTPNLLPSATVILYVCYIVMLINVTNIPNNYGSRS